MERLGKRAKQFDARLLRTLCEQLYDPVNWRRSRSHPQLYRKLNGGLWTQLNRLYHPTKEDTKRNAPC